MTVQIVARRTKRPAQAARRTQQQQREETRRLLRGLLGDRDFVVMLTDLARRGPAAFPRWQQVLRFRLAQGEIRHTGAVDVPVLVGRAYHLLGCDQKRRDAMQRALRG